MSSVILFGFSAVACWLFARLVSGTMDWLGWGLLYAVVVVLACAFFMGADEMRGS